MFDSSMPNDQILMGAGIAVLCATGIWKSRWLLTHTKKGQRLVRWFGDTNAVWVLRALMIAGMLFGVLLAVDWIRPLRW